MLEDVGVLHPRLPAPPARPPGELRFDWAVVEQVRPQVDDPSPEWPSVLSGIVCPLLVLAGGDASPVSTEHVAELVAQVQDGRAVALGTGHLVHAARPEAFVRELLAFLDEPAADPRQVQDLGEPAAGRGG